MSHPVLSSALLRQCFGVQLPVSEAEALAAAGVSPAVQDVDGFERAVRSAYSRDPATHSTGATQARPTSSLLALRANATAAAKTFVMSEAACAAAFEQLKNDADIPHGFADEGCIQRAHLAAHKLEQAHTYSEKAFCIPAGGDLRMTINTPHPLGYTFAMFHVAVCVFVQTAVGIERRVLDPTLADGPLTVEAWQARIRGTSKPDTAVYYTSRFIMHPLDRQDAPTTWRDKDLEQAVSWKQEYKLVEQDCPVNVGPPNAPQQTSAH